MSLLTLALTVTISAQYVAASRVNLRAEPNANAAVVARVVIGTPVTAKPQKDKTWCKVEITGAHHVGYTHCALLRSTRPTLEEAQAAFEKTAVDDPGFKDAVARWFYLSPSHVPLGRAVGRLQKSTSTGKKVEVVLEDLMHSLAGVRSGTDVRPVEHVWNKYDPDGYGMEVEPAVRAKLKKKKSLFREADDVFVVVGKPFLKRQKSRGGAARSPAGDAEVRYRSAHYAPRGLLEYSKLLADGAAVIDLTPPLDVNYDGPGKDDFLGIGAVRATFPERPRVWGVTDRGLLVEGSLVETQEAVANSCSNYNHVEIALAKPKTLAFAFVMPRAPANLRPKIEKLSKRAVGVDLDRDGVLDIVTARNPILGLDDFAGEPGDCAGWTVVNINGVWKIAHSLCGDYFCT